MKTAARKLVRSTAAPIAIGWGDIFASSFRGLTVVAYLRAPKCKQDGNKKQSQMVKSDLRLWYCRGRGFEFLLWRVRGWDRSAQGPNRFHGRTKEPLSTATSKLLLPRIRVGTLGHFSGLPLRFTVVEAEFPLSQARRNYDTKSTDAQPILACLHRRSDCHRVGRSFCQLISGAPRAPDSVN
jgi:hypothetical protein